MSPTSVSKSSRRRPVPVRGAVLLALALVAAIWSATYFGAEARMRRATARIVRLVEKAGAESPVALGLSANRLGGYLATNAVLELEDQGTLAAGKTEIVQFYANVRNLLDEISFANPQIAAAKTARGEVQGRRGRAVSPARAATRPGPAPAGPRWTGARPTTAGESRRPLGARPGGRRARKLAMNAVRLWIKAVRPYAYSASLVPVAIGGLHARATGAEFSGLRFGAALAAGVLLHTAANLWNDYYDFKYRVDRLGGGIGSGVLVHGEMTPARCFRGASICAALAALLGLWLATQVGWGLAALGAAGLFGAVAYSAGPLSPKHRALGEVWLFLLMGVRPDAGGTWRQTGPVFLERVAAGIPAGLLNALLLRQQLAHVPSDREAGLRTLRCFQAARGQVRAGLFAVRAERADPR
jgi:1,4-dihydroxy-2-naphthoate octaprenyltransferase